MAPTTTRIDSCLNVAKISRRPTPIALPVLNVLLRTNFYEFLLHTAPALRGLPLAVLFLVSMEPTSKHNFKVSSLQQLLLMQMVLSFLSHTLSLMPKMMTIGFGC